MAFMVELLIVLVLVAGLVAWVGPKMMDYLNRGQDGSVQSDLSNYATAAEANLINNGGSAYGTDPKAFATDGAAPKASQDNKYKAWIIPQGTDAGYVIVGINRNSEQLWGVSSYNGGAVVEMPGDIDWDGFTGYTPSTGATDPLKAPTTLLADAEATNWQADNITD